MLINSTISVMLKPNLQPNDDGTIDLSFDVTEKENIGQFPWSSLQPNRDFMGTMNLSIPNFRGKGEKLDLGFSDRRKPTECFTEFYGTVGI